MKTPTKFRRFFIFIILCGAILFSAVSRSENVSAEKKIKSLPDLSGDKAKDYLKEKGLYHPNL
ncbi:MAG: hypothetical protein KIS76_07160 [Pyrinomonadaceae bacterium]|nr:hypothetical protein [Pyrinomonadaceae bacterium]